ncbi:MAG TPA: hypothetical protein PLM79_16150 [Syntrophobacteraceae bacterium]|nr:hypothetical protein [Syntrophobacteraceae bacterium]
MKRSISVALALIMVVSVVGLSYAAGTIEEQIRGQERRIDQGVAKGTLTPSEAETLRGNLDHIKDRYNKAVRDNILTKSEQNKLKKMLKNNSEMIYKKKHNQVRRLY